MPRRRILLFLFLGLSSPNFAQQFRATVDAGRWDYYATPGHPKVPVIWKQLLIPYGQKLDTAKVVTLEAEKKVAITFPTVPFPQAACQNNLPPEKPATFEKGETYPKERMGKPVIVKKMGYTIAYIPVFPYLYQPNEKQALYVGKSEVRYNTKVDKASDLYRGMKSDRDAIRPIVENDDILKSYPITEKGKPSPLYLVIGPSTLTSAASLKLLLAQKEKEGLRTKVVTTEAISTGFTGRDLPEKIRNAIKQEYTTNEAAYVLLVGDGYANTKTRRFYVRQTSLAADFYFACLDGSFDGNGNDYFGESTDGDDGEDVDLACEVAVGRAPASSVEDVDRFVEKTLKYAAISGASVLNVLNVAEKMDSYTLAAGTMDQLIDGGSAGDISTQGYPSKAMVERLYEDFSYTTDATEVADTINKNKFYTVNHLGHAKQTYCMRMEMEDLALFKNTMPFFYITQACLEGDLTMENWASRLVVGTKYGAAAMVANSHYGWYQPGGSNGYSSYYHNTFYDTVFAEGSRLLGKTHFRAKERLIPEIQASSYVRWVAYETNLLGDPALRFGF